ncbi:glycosyltransferase [Spongisporangium articulatum]|uniref:Glycosyltransferase n=1 Tax=Spongisporangium articulatum TaxID=3362603 RepID=A0ABW8ARE8_9ACTN
MATIARRRHAPQSRSVPDARCATGWVGIVPALEPSPGITLRGPAWAGSHLRSPPARNTCLLSVASDDQQGGRVSVASSTTGQPSRAGHRGVLAGLRVVLVGADASPHVTGFPGFSSALVALLRAQDCEVEELLAVPPAPRPAADGAPPPSAPPPGARPDLVIAVTPGPGAAAAAAVAEKHAAPLLVVGQGSDIPPRPGGGVGERLAARLDDALAARADRWAVTGHAVAEQLVLHGVAADRIDRIPYWSDPAARAGDPGQAALRAELGWPTKGLVVACPVGADLGSVSTVLTASALLEKRGEGVRLVLTGSGGSLRRVRDRGDVGSDAVHEVASDRYLDALRAADLVLLHPPGAGRTDASLPGRVAAALLAGRPIVAGVGDGPAPVDLAEVDGCCVWVGAGGPEQVAEALEMLADSGHTRDQLAAAAREYAAVRLDPQAAADALEATVSATLAQRSR